MGKRVITLLETLPELRYYLKLNEEQLSLIEKDLEQYEDEQEAERIQNCFEQLDIDRMDNKLFEERMESILTANETTVRRSPESPSARRCRSVPRNFAPSSSKRVWQLRNLEDLKLLRELSRGSSSAVWKAQLGEHVIVAKQYYSSTAVTRKQILEKIKFMRHVDHPHSRSHYGVGKNTRKEFFEFKEFIVGGSAADLVHDGPMNEVAAIHVISQVLDALSFIHNNDMIHGNIQPKKILISQKGIVKIAEFLETPNKLSIVPHYSAPEVVGSGEFTQKSDVWSIGCLLLELITGVAPFASKGPFATIQELTKGTAIPEIPIKASKTCAAFLTACWQFDEASRPSIDELCQHKFLVQSPAGHSSLLGFIRRKLYKKESSTNYFAIPV